MVVSKMGCFQNDGGEIWGGPPKQLGGKFWSFPPKMLGVFPPQRCRGPQFWCSPANLEGKQHSEANLEGKSTISEANLEGKSTIPKQIWSLWGGTIFWSPPHLSTWGGNKFRSNVGGELWGGPKSGWGGNFGCSPPKFCFGVTTMVKSFFKLIWARDLGRIKYTNKVQ